RRNGVDGAQLVVLAPAAPVRQVLHHLLEIGLGNVSRRGCLGEGRCARKQQRSGRGDCEESKCGHSSSLYCWFVEAAATVEVAANGRKDYELTRGRGAATRIEANTRPGVPQGAVRHCLRIAVDAGDVSPGADRPKGNAARAGNAAAKIPR